MMRVRSPILFLMWTCELREKARGLRREGKLYKEIHSELGVCIPKGTLSGWCRGIKIPDSIQTEHSRLNLSRLADARKKALEVNRRKRQEWLTNIRESNVYLTEIMKNFDARKIALAMLYLGEGSKRLGSVRFGNSDPKIIGLFMHLIRACYDLDEEKFRCTVQCRADQDRDVLERQWKELTGIPLRFFRRSKIDPRTIGKKTKKPGYMGVCVIDYFSSFVFNDILQAADIISEGR